MGSTAKKGKSEMRKILGDGRKWKNGKNFGGSINNSQHFMCCINGNDGINFIDLEGA